MSLALNRRNAKTDATFGGEEWDPLEERLAVDELQRRLFGGAAREGVRVGRYLVHERIADGGMGVVYRAHDPKLERDVALKLIRSRREDSESAHQRLLAEAKALAGVSHPNVVEVYDAGSFEVAEVFGSGEGAGVFIVMAFVEGETLRDWLQTPRRWQDVLAPFVAAGEGLAAVHVAGLVHRDFKPSNVLVGKPVRIVDFGLAAGVRGLGSNDPAVAGTPRYMAPEQFGGEYSAKSDQYSFCASLWRALYGAAPPSVAHGSAPQWRPPPNSRVPRWLHAVVEQGLELDPQARHADMRTLLSALSRKSSRRARWGGVMVGVGVAAATGFAAGQDIDPRCVGTPLAGSWNAKTSETMRTRFLDSDLEFSQRAFDDVEGYMDRFVEEWKDVRSEACAIEPSRVREETLACLHSKELSAQGLLEVYAEPDPLLIERTSSSLDGLSSPKTCIATSRKSGPPMQPSADLERAVVFFALGKNDRARAAIERAEAEIVDPRQRARLTRYRCHLAGDEGDRETALEVCTQAWNEAESAGLNGVAARMLLVLAQYRAGEDYERAWESLTVAEAKLASMQEATALRLRATAVRAELIAKRDPAAAAELFARNIAAKEAYYGSATTRTVHDRVGLAGLLEELRRFEEADEVYEVVLAQIEERLGPRHPHIAALLNNWGTMELVIGRYDDARDHLEAALELKLATPGWNTRRAASTHANLARLWDSQEELRRAEHHAREAVSLSGKKPKAFVSAMLARVLRRRGRVDEAVEVARHAWARDSSDTDLAIELALSLVATGQPGVARDVLKPVKLRFDEELAPTAEEPSGLAAQAHVELALGNVELALDLERAASAAFSERGAFPSEWAVVCTEMAAAFEPVAPERAEELRARARELRATYGPRFVLAGAP